MPLGRIETTFRAGALAAAAFALSFAVARDARADGTVTPTGKGIVGGTLLGGEIVSIGMGAAGVHRSWPYLVFTPVGMIGGGVVGYFVEQGSSGTTANGVTTGANPEPSLYMLAAGMALVIPALVVSLNATAYRPPEGDRTEPANNEPATDAPRPKSDGTTVIVPTTQRSTKPGRDAVAALPHIPVSLLDVYKSQVAFGVPAVQIKPLYTPQEMWKYGVAQGTEVKIPVFQATF